MLHWQGLADEDYIAARLLLLNGFLKQGAILANTAVEKYLKLLLFSKEKQIPQNHNIFDLYKQVLDLNISGIKPVNTGFISFLYKCYQLRYLDQIKNGLNLYFDQIKILVELDRTVGALRKDFKFQTVNGTKIDSRLDFLVQKKDQILLEKNIIFGQVLSEKLFKEKTKWIALMVYGNNNIIEGTGENIGTSDDGKFDVVGVTLG